MSDAGVAAAKHAAVSVISTMKVDLPHMIASAAPAAHQDTYKHSTAQHSTAQHSTAQHSTEETLSDAGVAAVRHAADFWHLTRTGGLATHDLHEQHHLHSTPLGDTAQSHILQTKQTQLQTQQHSGDE
jgi:hypothetical protein